MTKTSVLSDKNLPLAIHLVAVFRFKDYYIFTAKKTNLEGMFHGLSSQKSMSNNFKTCELLWCIKKGTNYVFFNLSKIEDT